MTPEETILRALERLKTIPSRHGGIPTYAAFAALEALVQERDELLELSPTPADEESRLDAAHAGKVLRFDRGDSRPVIRSATTAESLDQKAFQLRSGPGFPPPP